MRLVKGAKKPKFRNRGRKAVVLVAGFAGASASVSGAWAQCTDPSGIGGLRNAAYGTGTAIASIVSTIGVVNTSSLAQSSAFTGASGTNQPVMQGGIWVREVGGKVDSKANSTAALSINLNAPDNVGQGSRECNIRTRTEYLGTQLGFDIAKLNIAPGTNVTVGLTGGYTEIHSKDRTSGEGTFSSSFQVPFGGVYAALTSGGLTIDGQLRFDAYSGRVKDYQFVFDNRTLGGTASDQSISFRNQALFSQDITGHSSTFIGNIGYRAQLPQSSAFIEPSVGIIWSEARIDDLKNSGNAILPGPVGTTPPSTVKFDSIGTALGRASVRVGTNIQTPSIIWQPFAVASVFHEFAGDATAVANGDFGALGRPSVVTSLRGSSTTNNSVDRVGTYGHIGLGLAGVSTSTGWSGYARVDYREGDSIRGYNFNVGGRYQLAAEGGAASADLKGEPVRAPAPTSWTGPYLGASAGGAFSSQDWNSLGRRASADDIVRGTGATVGQFVAVFGRDFSEVGKGVAEHTGAGFIGSGQLGYNVQLGTLVVGAEADWGLTNTRGGGDCPGLFFSKGIAGEAQRGNFFNCRTAINQLGFFTARVGQTWDNALLYLKGGLAVGEVESHSRFLSVNNRFDEREQGETKWQLGWTLGAGVEYALGNRWSIRGEYMHFNLGTEAFLIDNATDFDRLNNRTTANVKTQGDIARVGINYRFGAN